MSTVFGIVVAVVVDSVGSYDKNAKLSALWVRGEHVVS